MKAMPSSARTQRGLTLLEMLIVIVIIAILAAVVWPAYGDYVRKARRAECSAVLANMASALERRFSASHRYVDSRGEATFPGGGVNASCPASGGEVFYELSFVEVSAASFTMQAVPVGAQRQDPCGTLTLDHLGTKGAGGDGELSAAQCW